jgi:UDP-glucose:glycoprotein glucosyltransferase
MWDAPLTSISETAAQENETCYFGLLDRIAQGTFTSAKTDKELYEKFLEVLKEDGHITNPEALSTFKLALTMHSAAPRIEAHYQFYATAAEPALGEDQDGCDNWFLSSGNQYCQPTLDAAKGSVKPGSYVTFHSLYV